MRNGFLKMLAVFAAFVAVPMRAAREWINRKDPFNTRGLYTTRVARAWHTGGFRIAALVAMVAATMVPGAAHAATWNPETNRFFGYATGAYGLIGWAGATTPANQKVPFRYGTTKRRVQIGTFQVTPGAKLPSVKIPQVGMMSRVIFVMTGTYTVAVAPLVIANTDGFDSIFGNATLTVNNGSAQIVSVSGIGLNAINKNINTALPIKVGAPAGVGNVNGSSLPLAIGASSFRYSGILPVNANQGYEFEMGLVNLQAEQIQATIDLTFNPLSSLFTVPANATNFTAQIALSYEYFEIPDLTQYSLPPYMLVRTIEEGAAPITAVGPQVYTLNRLGTMIEYHGVLILNLLYGDVFTNVSQTQLMYNVTDTTQNMLNGDLEVYDAELYGSGISLTQAPTPSAATPASRKRMQSSAVTMNFWASGDSKNTGDFRDAIDTEENTTTQIINTIAAGTALNAGKDNLIHVRRVVQRLVPA